MGNKVFGIDLGTTYSCIAYVDENGQPVVVKNKEGSYVTPSVVNFAGPEDIIVGKVAKEIAEMESDNTIALVKTLMGKSNFAINYNGKDYCPEEISSFILRKVTGDASELLNEEVKDVVITCPAYFGTEERKATKNAGIMAGLNVIEIISEPTAAAICYGSANSDANKTFLVYDLGGGTFDVTVMGINNGKITVICSDGNHQLGGKDWDDRIMNFLADKFMEATGHDGDFDDDAIQTLRNKAEEAKFALTHKPETKVNLTIDGFKAKLILTRDEFDTLTESLLNQSLEKTDDCIAVAKSKGYTIDEILLVGGSTRMPQVRAAIESKYSGIRVLQLEPDEAVAKGAAIFALGKHSQELNAWIEEMERKIESGEEVAAEEVQKLEEAKSDEIIRFGLGGAVGNIDVNDIVLATTKSYGLKACVNGKDKIYNLIVKNEKMEGGSVSVTEEFGTKENNQTSTLLEVFESDYMDQLYDVDETLKLGEAAMEGIPLGLPAGSPILVTFTLNGDGILEISALEKTHGTSLNVTMQATGGSSMSDEEVQAATSQCLTFNIE